MVAALQSAASLREPLGLEAAPASPPGPRTPQGLPGDLGLICQVGLGVCLWTLCWKEVGALSPPCPSDAPSGPVGFCLMFYWRLGRVGCGLGLGGGPRWDLGPGAHHCQVLGRPCGSPPNQELVEGQQDPWEGAGQVCCILGRWPHLAPRTGNSRSLTPAESMGPGEGSAVRRLDTGPGGALGVLWPSAAEPLRPSVTRTSWLSSPAAAWPHVGPPS